jgi:hypothetical protein
MPLTTTREKEKPTSELDDPIERCTSEQQKVAASHKVLFTAQLR